MKPDWKDAPEWANWLAMDFDGEWYWFENKPDLHNDKVWRETTGLILDADYIIKPKDTLESRPARDDHRCAECGGIHDTLTPCPEGGES